MPVVSSRILATGCGVALCLGAGLWLDSLSINAHYLSVIPAIAGACAVGGLGLALWAILFSAAGLWLFFLPSPDGTVMCALAHLGVFVTVAAFMCWIIDGLRRTNDALSRDNVALGFKVSILLNRAKPR